MKQRTEDSGHNFYSTFLYYPTYIVLELTVRISLIPTYGNTCMHTESGFFIKDEVNMKESATVAQRQV